MKSKQLANVLIKIIGLYVCLCAIPGVISDVCSVILYQTLMASKAIESARTYQSMISVGSYAIGYVVQATAGLFLIIKSRKLAEYWFKGDDE